jgi:outer membrane receptor protein involved in Fe transport
VGIKASNWELAVDGYNLTDKQYITSGTSFLSTQGFAVGAYSPPRTIAASLKYRFGT